MVQLRLERPCPRTAVGRLQFGLDIRDLPGEQVQPAFEVGSQVLVSGLAEFACEAIVGSGQVVECQAVGSRVRSTNALFRVTNLPIEDADSALDGSRQGRRFFSATELLHEPVTGCSQLLEGDAVRPRVSHPAPTVRVVNPAGGLVQLAAQLIFVQAGDDVRTAPVPLPGVQRAVFLAVGAEQWEPFHRRRLTSGFRAEVELPHLAVNA